MSVGDVFRPERSTEHEFFASMSEQLYSAVISDVLDDLGVPDRVMGSEIRPLSPDFVVVGRAKTVLWVDVYEEGPDPYSMEIEATDSVRPGEVVIACTNESRHNAPWGELMSTAAQARGANGAILDGLVRDTRKILKLGFPVFCAGIRPVDSRGRGQVVDYDVTVKVGGVLVKPGDLVFGDNDGVVVVPRGLEEEVCRGAFEKAQKENSSRKELKEGRLLREVFERYGVL